MKQPISTRTRAIVRRQCLRRMCCAANGKLSKDAIVVLAMLKNYCNGVGAYPPPRAAATGAIDPLAMAQVAGRREVFDLLTNMLSVTLEERHNLEDDLI